MVTLAASPPPPFTAETEAFRAEYRAFIDERVRPHIDAWEAAEWFDGEAFGWFAERGWLGVTMPTEYGGLGLGARVRRGRQRGARALRVGRVRGRHRRAHGHRLAADRALRDAGAEGALARAGDARREDRRAGDHRAGRRLRRRLASARAPSASTAAGSSTARRPTSPTACGRTSTSPRCARPPRAGTAACPSWSSRRATASPRRTLNKLGWHASDTATVAFDDVFVPDDHLLGELDKGFYLIMANFQGERLGMSLTALGRDARVVRAARRVGRGAARRRRGGATPSPSWALKVELAAAIAYGVPRARRSPARTSCARSPRPSCSPSAPTSRSRRRACGCMGLDAPPSLRARAARRPARPHRRRHRRDHARDHRALATGSEAARRQPRAGEDEDEPGERAGPDASRRARARRRSPR